MESKSKIYILGLIVICGLSFFMRLDVKSPPTIMEARNFITAREMVEKGNWLIPTLNDHIRIRKPPLPTWITAGSLWLFDKTNNLYALRLPAAFMGVLAIVFLFGFTRDLTGSSQQSFYAAAILATSFLFVDEARTGTWDIYSTVFMLGGIWFLWKALNVSGLLYWFVAGVFMALAFMSKGPVAHYAMLLPFVFGALFVRKQLKFSLAGLLVMVITMVILSGLWPLYLYLEIPDIALKIADEESNAWIDKHNRPVWFYLHFPLFTGVWLVLLLWTFIHHRKIRESLKRKDFIFVLGWFVSGLILLSIIPEKKERYFLPMIPVLAMLMSYSINYLIEAYRSNALTRGERIWTRVHTSLMLLFVLAIGVIVYLTSASLLSWMTFTYLPFAAVAIYLLIRFRTNFPTVMATTVLVMVGFSFFALPVVERISRDNPGYDDLRNYRRPADFSAAPIYSAVEINPIRLWELGEVIPQRDFEKITDSQFILISDEKLENAKKTENLFPNPSNEKEVLYFNYFDRPN